MRVAQTQLAILQFFPAREAAGHARTDAQSLSARRTIFTRESSMTDEPIGATKERLAKAGEDVEEFKTETGRATVRLLDGSILDALISKAEQYPINGNQYAAGRQLHSDWDMAGAGKIGAVDTTREAVDGGQAKDMTAKAMDAQGRYRRAIKAVGHTHAHVLFHVVLMEERLELYGQKWCCHQSKKLAKVAAKEALRRALTELAFHYGFAKKPEGRFVSHAFDYKPTIQEPANGN